MLNSNIVHYTDDGYSGVNFNRPGFCEMQRKIENGEVAPVIIKDLSRFGRNYIDTKNQIGTELMPINNILMNG